LTKEISVASNIKNRSNRQNVQRLLTILNKRLSNVNLNTIYNLGIFCFVGINEYGEEIIEFIEPEIKLDLFYYSCANKFETDITSKYIGTNISGTIIFVNGDECLGYQFITGQFVKIFGLNGALVKRHKKGGFSANRFARIAEESRHLYVVRICDKINELVNKSEKEENIWIYGSEEIVQMVLKQCSHKLISGGFLNFNSNTIRNTKYWLDVISKSQEKNYDSIYKEILEYLELNPDMLDFDPSNKDTMKYYLEKKSTDINKLKPNQIPLMVNSKYYAQLMVFDYIGIKFYNYQINEYDDDNDNAAN
jgi:hypothetical protein